MSMRTAWIVAAVVVLLVARSCSMAVSVEDTTVQVDDGPVTKPESVISRELSLISLFMTHFLEQDKQQATTAPALSPTASAVSVEIDLNASDPLPDSDALITMNSTTPTTVVVVPTESPAPTMASLQSLVTW